MTCPRVLVAGTSSGCGKTTAVCALLLLLKRRALAVSSLKCGPDYLDPMFHRAILQTPSANLDPFFCVENLLRYLLSENAGRDLTLLEGVMGYYDGTGESGTDNSTYTVAQKTGTPVVLLINARGAAASVLAVLEGFVRFQPDSAICGVIFNQISPSVYEACKKGIQKRFSRKVLPLGYLPKLPEDCLLSSRHLGLVTPQEVPDLTARLEKLADLCENTLDISGLLALAKTAGPLSFHLPLLPLLPPIRLAAAKDRAFCFFYEETLRLFRKMGAQIDFFSPLADEPVPEQADGLLLPGGYPELYTDRLAQNRRAKESVRHALTDGMPTLAECGGFQYLGAALDGREMCGILPHHSHNTGRLVRFGYVTLTSHTDGLLGKAGLILPAHEFHYYDSTQNGASFTAVTPGKRTWDCIVHTDTLYAGYPHLYLWASLPAAQSFYQKCLSYRQRKELS